MAFPMTPNGSGLKPEELKGLAEEHMKHDLNQSDRDALHKAASTVRTHVTAGSLLGVGLGVFLAYRARAHRTAMFNAFKAHEQPVAVRFSGGREEPIPDLTTVVKPSVLGDVATYMFLGGGGLFFGGSLGTLTGGYRGKRIVGSDPGRRERVETALRRFQADALRKQADALDRKDRSSIKETLLGS